MPDQEPDLRERFRYLALGQVGLEMVAPVVVGLLLDRYFGWAPWLTIVGAVLGFGGGMYHLLAILKNGGGRDEGGRESP